MTVTYQDIRGNPSDPFSKLLLEKLSQEVSCDAFYIDSLNLKTMLRQQFNHATVLIMIKDNFEFESYYDYWQENICITVDIVKQIAEKNVNKKFIFLVEHEIDEKLIDKENVYFISLGGRLPCESDKYPTIKPILEKNISTEKIGICLNRQMRPQRIALASMLYGMGLDEHIHISAMHLHKQLDKINNNNILDHLSWRFDENHNQIKKYMSNGFSKLYQFSAQFQVNDEIYSMDEGAIIKIDNAQNFEKNLRDLYSNSFLEIISETWYGEPWPMLTEKYLNSVYGCNFPILLVSVGSIRLLRDIGFDMFDDIVDHSYDEIINPIDRMYAAIEYNKHLIYDRKGTIDLWFKNLARFEKNVIFAQKDMYDWFDNRASRQYNNILNA